MITNSKYTDYELDAFQAVWSLSRQKSRPSPLTSEQLKALVELGRVDRATLTDDEKKLIESKSIVEKNYKDNFKTITKYLYQTIIEDYSEGVLKLFRQMNPAERAELMFFLFKLKYGVSPEFFLKHLVDLAK